MLYVNYTSIKSKKDIRGLKTELCKINTTEIILNYDKILLFTKVFKRQRRRIKQFRIAYIRIANK